MVTDLGLKVPLILLLSLPESLLVLLGRGVEELLTHVVVVTLPHGGCFCLSEIDLYVFSSNTADVFCFTVSVGPKQQVWFGAEHTSWAGVPIFCFKQDFQLIFLS